MTNVVSLYTTTTSLMLLKFLKVELTITDLVIWFYMRANYNGLPKHPLDDYLVTKEEIEYIFEIYNKTTQYVKLEAPKFIRYGSALLGNFNYKMLCFLNDQKNAYKHYREVCEAYMLNIMTTLRSNLLNSTTTVLPQFPLESDSLKNVIEYNFVEKAPIFELLDGKTCTLENCSCCKKNNKRHDENTYGNTSKLNDEINFPIQDFLNHPSLLKLVNNLIEKKTIKIEETKRNMDLLTSYNLSNYLDKEEKIKTFDKNIFTAVLAEHIPKCILGVECPDRNTYAMLISDEVNINAIPKSPQCPYFQRNKLFDNNSKIIINKKENPINNININKKEESKNDKVEPKNDKKEDESNLNIKEGDEMMKNIINTLNEKSLQENKEERIPIIREDLQIPIQYNDLNLSIKEE
jgi:hypothetical protein